MCGHSQRGSLFTWPQTCTAQPWGIQLASPRHRKLLQSCVLSIAFYTEIVCTRMLSCVQFFVTLWTIARQAPLSMGLSRQEYWSGLPFPPPGDLPNSGIKPVSVCLLHGQMGSLPLAPPLGSSTMSFCSLIAHFFFYCWIIFHSMDIPWLVYPFTYWRASWLLPGFNRYFLDCFQSWNKIYKERILPLGGLLCYYNLHWDFNNESSVLIQAS